MLKRLKIEAVVPAAGVGIRLKSKASKPLIRIKKRPLIIYALKALNAHPAVSKIIVLADVKNISVIKGLIVKNKISKVKRVAVGGKTRKDSVAIGLKYLDRDTDFVLIHDGARPFVTKDIISRVILGARNYGASIAGVPLKPTIKMVSAAGGSASGGKGQACPTMSFGRGLRGKEKFVSETLSRDNIYEIQTPQVFRKSLILEAHQKFKNTAATDDAYLVEKLGKKIAVVDGSYFNIKITTPEDLVFAQAISINLMTNAKTQNPK